MSSRKKRYPSLLIAAAMAAFLPPAFAQSDTNSASAGKIEEPLQLDAFTVTGGADSGYMANETVSAAAARANLMKVPQTINVINEQMLRDLGVTDDFTMALQVAAGGNDRRSYNGGEDFFMWGFRVLGSLKNSLPYFNNGLNLGYDVARVEVIKGPAAMMFGQIANVGGVINYVTRKPTKTAQYSAQLTYGSNDLKRAALHASGPITDSIRYRLDLGALDSDSNGRKWAFNWNRFLGTEVEWDVNKNVRLNVDVAYQKEDEFASLTMLDPTTLKIIDMPDDYTVNEPWAHRPKETFRANATLTAALGKGFTSRSVLGYSNATNDWLRDQSTTVDIPNHTINKFASSFATTNHFVSLQQDFVADFNTGPLKHRATFGGDQRNEYNRNITVLNALTVPAFDYLNPVYGALPTTLPGPSGSTNTRSRSRISGLYVHEQMDFWKDRITVVAGLRYNNQVTVSGAPVVSGGANNVSYGDKTTPRYGLVISPVEAVSLFYNNSKSFQFNSGNNYLSQPLIPSVGTLEEFGAKLDVPVGKNTRIRASGSLIDMSFSNVRVVFTQGPGDPIPGGSGVKQDGVQTNKGWQWNATIQQKFPQVGTLNMMVNQYHGDIKNELGVRPPKVPNNTWGGTGSFTFDQGFLKGFRFGGSVSFVGQQGGFNLSTSAGAVIPTKVPKRTIYNAMAGYSRGRYDLQLNVNNLRDEKYIAGAESGLWIYADPGLVSQLSLTIRF